VSDGLPSKAKVGVPGNYVEISPVTYFVARRMERAGLLRPGQALMLAATLPRTEKQTPKKGRKK